MIKLFKIVNNSMVILSSILVTSFFSCKKDEIQSLDDKGVLAYLAPGDAAYNVVNGKGVKIWTDQVFQSSSAAFQVVLSRPFNQDAQFGVQIDTTYLHQYDSMYQVVSPRFKPANFKIEGNGQVTIKAGDVSSDSLRVALSDTAGLDLTKTYIIPMRLSSANNIPVSRSRKVVYIKLELIKVTSSLSTGSNNVIRIAFNKPPTGDIVGPAQIAFQALLNSSLNKAIQVGIVYDASLISSYNAANGTAYVAFPEGTFSLSKDNVNIVSGATSSAADSFRIQFNNYNSFSKDYIYLLPVKIKDAGNVAANSNKIKYIQVNVNVQNIDPSNSGLTGTTVARTGWTVKASNFLSNTYAAEKSIDNNTNTSWLSSSGLPQSLQLNMGTVRTIKGFNINSAFLFGSYYGDIGEMEVYSSKDGVVWNQEGLFKSQPSPTKTVKFITPVNAQYFRLNITGTNDDFFVGMAELNAVE